MSYEAIILQKYDSGLLIISVSKLIIDIKTRYAVIQSKKEELIHLMKPFIKMVVAGSGDLGWLCI